MTKSEEMWSDWQCRRKAPCPRCRRPRTVDGHDPCIANLPGVLFACCGHGKIPGYIYFENGTIIRFKLRLVEFSPEESPHFERRDAP